MVITHMYKIALNLSFIIKNLSSQLFQRGYHSFECGNAPNGAFFKTWFSVFVRTLSYLDQHPQIGRRLGTRSWPPNRPSQTSGTWSWHWKSGPAARRCRTACWWAWHPAKHRHGPTHRKANRHGHAPTGCMLLSYFEQVNATMVTRLVVNTETETVGWCRTNCQEGGESPFLREGGKNGESLQVNVSGTC